MCVWNNGLSDQTLPAIYIYQKAFSKWLLFFEPECQCKYKVVWFNYHDPVEYSLISISKIFYDRIKDSHSKKGKIYEQVSYARSNEVHACIYRCQTQPVGWIIKCTLAPRGIISRGKPYLGLNINDLYQANIGTTWVRFHLQGLWVVRKHAVPKYFNIPFKALRYSEFRFSMETKNILEINYRSFIQYFWRNSI